jgi:hypothetical protein
VGTRFLAITVAIAIGIALPGTSTPTLAAPEDFRSQWVGQSAYPRLGAGAITSYTVLFRNTGTTTWRRGSAMQVNLGIAADSREFFDQGMAVNWLSPDRIVTTVEESVVPGGTATFTFTIRAPAAPGVYRVPLRLVVDGVTWLNDEGVYFVLLSESGFGARWMTQTPYPTLTAGNATTVSVTFRNTGSRPFVRGAAGQQLNLGVASDDTSWRAHGVGWLSPNRTATTNEAVVLPGATASFTFVLRAPPAAGKHVLRLRPVVDGVAWLEDEGVHVQITVLGLPGVVVGAGDIATCPGSGDEATSALLDSIPGTVVTLGDNAYDRGSPQEFVACYDPSWGRHRARTRPALGNHEYATLAGAGHFAYFGPAAGELGKGYYSYDVASWHVIVLNSNCFAIGGCGPGSPQEQWLRADLAASSAQCTLAYWHHPRFSSGPHGNLAEMDAFWRALYAAGADVVLVGHDHHYERFAPQDPNGVADPARGIRQFIAGTGGAPLRSVSNRAANSEVVRADTHGVIKLSLYADRFEWEFIPVADKAFSDRGDGPCH